VRTRPQLLPRLEISQIRRRLILRCGHDGAVRALEVGLIADHALAVAAVLGPFRIFLRQAPIGLEHRPGAREGIVDKRDLFMEAQRIGSPALGQLSGGSRSERADESS
jgi:hypothetical protein